METLVQLDTGYACGGIIVRDNVCVEAAPIFGWMVGKRLDAILRWPKIREYVIVRGPNSLS